MSARAVNRIWVWAYVLIVLCFGLITYVYYLRSELVDCLNEQAVERDRRTAAIALATDGERVADLALIRGPASPELRARAIAARERTDRVRAEYPAPPVEPCK